MILRRFFLNGTQSFFIEDVFFSNESFFFIDAEYFLNGTQYERIPYQCIEHNYYKT